MKFTLESAPGIQIHDYQHGAVTLRYPPTDTTHTHPLVVHRSSLILSRAQNVQDWAVSQASEIEHHHFEQVWQTRPEIVLFGSGQRMIFPTPEIRQGFAEKKIGFEAMDTAAACRTYSVLMAEGRDVMAYLIIN